MRTRVACIVVAHFCALLSAQGADFYVSPQGNWFGNGSFHRPWNLQTALRQTVAVRPGDTVWLRGGVYCPQLPFSPGFCSQLTGDDHAPVVVRPYPGERPVLIEGANYRGKDRQVVLSVWGSHTWFSGLEITCTNDTRIIPVAGPSPTPTELPMASGVDVVGTDIKLINLIIHDTRGGLSIWASATNAEAYGCLIFNNGWVGLDGGHGVGIYTQNLRGNRRLRDNIIFNQFSPGIYAFTVNSSLRNFSLERNVVFNNAHMAEDTSKDTGAQVLVGGGPCVEHVQVLDNCFYQALDLHGPVFRPDYGAVSNSDLICAGNYIAGGSGGGNYLASLTRYDSLIFTNNTLVSTNGFLLNLEARAHCVIDGNEYYGDANQNFSLTTGNAMHQADFSYWQSVAAFDAHGRYVHNGLPPNRILVMPNAYEPKRATIVIYNWIGADKINVDVAGAVDKGDTFVVRNAQDFFAPPVLTGTYDGTPIALPMTNLTVAIPHGLENTNAVPKADKQFHVFVLIGSSAPLPSKK